MAVRAASLARRPVGIASAGGSRGLRGELLGALLSGPGRRARFAAAAEGGLEVVGGDADAVVRDAPLREVVGADLRRAVAGAHLGLAEGALFLGPLLHLACEEAALEDLHGLLLV